MLAGAIYSTSRVFDWRGKYRASMNAGTRTYEKRSTKPSISDFGPHWIVIFVQDHQISLQEKFYNANFTRFTGFGGWTRALGYILCKKYE
jgi:hypothetical protein